MLKKGVPLFLHQSNTHFYEKSNNWRRKRYFEGIYYTKKSFLLVDRPAEQSYYVYIKTEE